MATLQAELKRLNEQTLAVARQFEQEAAARAEAEAISATLRTAYELLLADADALRGKLEEHQDGPSTAPRAGGQSGNPSAAS